MNERRNVPGDSDWYQRIASQIPNPDQSPLYDVRNPAPASCEGRNVRSDVSRTMSLVGQSARLRSFELRRGSLRYDPACRAVAGAASEGWWSQTGSNRRPHACKARALPAELWPRTRRRMLAGLPSRSSRQPARLRLLGSGAAALLAARAKAGGPGKT